MTSGILTRTGQFGALIYNSQLLKASDVPNSYAEFVDPAWKGKLVLTYPNDDDAVAYLFSTIINNYGWEWFEALAQQDVQWIRGTGQPSDVVSEGNSSYVLTFTSNPSGAQNIASKVLNEPRLLWPQSAAIFASTTKPESAKLFLSWMLSEERQQTRASQGLYVPLKSLNSTAGPVWNDLYTGVSQFATFMQDRASVERWRFQYETTIGTAQGVSPVLSVLGSTP
jgi:ABC-type Fe3+ transport system substrate-binding protein